MEKCACYSTVRGLILVMFEETFKRMDDARLREAEYHFRRAYQLQMDGQITEAIDQYQRSIAVFPTAEAHTFLGWAFSHRGEYDAAIASCESAIEVDSEFGNPYNDIGAYLIAMNQLEESVPWLQKAKEARRYEARHYPYFNLGRVFELQGRWEESLSEYESALRLYPEYDAARQAVERMRALMVRRN